MKKMKIFFERTNNLVRQTKVVEVFLTYFRVGGKRERKREREKEYPLVRHHVASCLL